MNLGIKLIESDKQNILQRPTMKDGQIPKHPSVAIFNGRAGSGKSMLLLNLLSRPEFYGPDESGKSYFDRIVLMGSTLDSDDLYKVLDKKSTKVTVILNPTEEDIQGVLDKQKASIKGHKNISKAKRTLIVFEDMQSNQKLMRTRAFLTCFIASRHHNLSTWLCSQSWTRTPRSCRLQCNSIFYFQGSASELNLLAEEFCPPNYTKREFMKIVDYATKEPYSFLFINMHMPWATRFRKNLETILELEK